MWLTSIIWLTSDLLLVLIFVRGVKSGMLRTYSLFYGCVVGVSLLVSLARRLVALSFGTRSLQYYYVYDLPTLFAPVLQIWILWDIYRRIIQYRKVSWRDSLSSAMMAIVLTVPVAWTLFWMSEGYLYYPYHTLTLFLQMALCLQICREAVQAREEIDLGQNLKGILLGLSLMVGCQTINFMGLLFSQSSTQVWRFSVQFIYFLALIVFTFTLWDYAPISRFDPSYQHRLKKVRREFFETLKSVLLNRR